ncbi:MAG: helix-turn-helix domain-containing protein [Clostridiaceae bacterium]|nr:helix-turn-helix domain-containing protein [Clostridiaceae bacterium]
MTEESKNKLMANMADNLAMLRVRLGLTQNELAEKLGISRHTVMNIENGKRELTWNNFLVLMLLFTKNESTNRLLNVLEIYTDEFNDFIKNKEKLEQETLQDK